MTQDQSVPEQLELPFDFSDTPDYRPHARIILRQNPEGTIEYSLDTYNPLGKSRKPLMAAVKRAIDAINKENE